MADTLAYVTSRELLLDGVKYTASIYRTGQKFNGLWECKRCQNQGGTPTAEHDADTAMERAFELISGHHAEHHA